jgi:hypothetical protein
MPAGTRSFIEAADGCSVGVATATELPLPESARRVT